KAEVEAEMERVARAREQFEMVPGLGDKIITKLMDAGFRSVREVAMANFEELTSIPGIGEKIALKIFDSCSENADWIEAKVAERDAQEAERLAQEAAERERLEAAERERLEAAQREAEEAERRAKEEAERGAAEQAAEAERLAQEARSSANGAPEGALANAVPSESSGSASGTDAVDAIDNEQ